MESSLNQKSLSTMIYLKDQQSFLIVSKRELEGLNSRTEQTGFTLISPKKSEEKQQRESQSARTSDSSPKEQKKQIFTSNQVKKPNGIDEGVQSRPKKTTQTKTQQIKMLKNTLVNSLKSITKEKLTKETERQKYNKLENLHWIETCSITESQSYDFDDAESVVIQMTEEQKDFFNNFLYQNPQQIEINQKEINTFQLLPIEQIVELRQEEYNHLPANKNEILRNFFRPKVNQSFKGKQSWMTSHTRSQSITKTPDKNEYLFDSPLL